MAKTLAQIQKQIDALQKEADAIKNKEKSEVVARIREAITHYGITASELGLSAGRRKPGPKPGGQRKAAGPAKKKGGVIKFRDEAGNTWSGRGPKPGWFKAALAAGKKPEDLKA